MVTCQLGVRERARKGHEKTFGTERHCHHLDCGDGFMALYLYQNNEL